MCGRAALTNQTLDEIADALDAEPVAPALYRPRYNLAPTDQVWVLALREGKRVLAPATWGLPPAAGARRPLINVRGESLVRGAFRSLFRDGRALFVCSGFYEWDKDRRPFFFTPAAREGDEQAAAVAQRGTAWLLLGALLASRGPADLPATAVLTTSPNTTVKAVHDRMPLVIAASDVDRWLGAPGVGDRVASDRVDGDRASGGHASDRDASALALVHPAPDGALAVTPVSPYVNNVRHDDPGCLAPLDPASAGVRASAADQLKLFS